LCVAGSGIGAEVSGAFRARRRAGLRVDVIVAPVPALSALTQATSTIPIVMAASSDPVGSGYVQSLSRPGGNITGPSLQSVDTMGKRLELLKELVAGASPANGDRTSRRRGRARSPPGMKNSGG
jgi:hypothetical protein